MPSAASYAEPVDTLTLELVGPLPAVRVGPQDHPEWWREGDPPECALEVLAPLCSALARDPRVALVLRFGDEAWPVDVGTDLCTLVEQLPQVARSLEGAFSIDLFEQGIERTLAFVPIDGDAYQVRCSRLVSPAEVLGTLRVSAAEVQASLRRLTTRFVAMAEVVGPELVRDPAYQAWRASLGGLVEPAALGFD